MLVFGKSRVLVTLHKQEYRSNFSYILCQLLVCYANTNCLKNIDVDLAYVISCQDDFMSWHNDIRYIMAALLWDGKMKRPQSRAIACWSPRRGQYLVVGQKGIKQCPLVALTFHLTCDCYTLPVCIASSSLSYKRSLSVALLSCDAVTLFTV